MRRAVWLLLVPLVSCVATNETPGSSLDAVAAPSGMCHAENDRGIGGTGLTDDRGLGGTGARSQTPDDRGIGGTGVSSDHDPARVADTGIIGVITGFGSVCLDGLEVGIDGATAVQVDNDAATDAALRIGQVAIIKATGSGAGLRAQSIAVRSEVLGPVETISGSGGLTIAGQQVSISTAPSGDAPLQPGDWVAVSGIRTSDGTIVASRIDRRSAGHAVVRGRLVRRGAEWLIGSLVLRLGPDLQPVEGADVSAAGRYDSGVLVVDALAVDGFYSDPVAYLGSGIQHYAIEAFVSGGAGRLRIAPSVEARVTPRLGGPVSNSLAVVQFDRRSDGSLVVTGLRKPGDPPPGSGLNGTASPPSRGPLGQPGGVFGSPFGTPAAPPGGGGPPPSHPPGK